MRNFGETSATPIFRNGLDQRPIAVEPHFEHKAPVGGGNKIHSERVIDFDLIPCGNRSSDRYGRRLGAEGRENGYGF